MRGGGFWMHSFMTFRCLLSLSSQYARADEMDRMKKEYTDCVTTLSDFATEAHRKLSEALEVSFLNVRLLIQDLEVRSYL
jgi:hypothetical protein